MFDDCMEVDLCHLPRDGLATIRQKFGQGELRYRVLLADYLVPNGPHVDQTYNHHHSTHQVERDAYFVERKKLFRDRVIA